MDVTKCLGNQRLIEHHSLYKIKTPPWKETVRRRCFQRLQSSRGKLVDKFRGLGLCSDEVVDVLMTEEMGNVTKQKTCLKLDELDDAEINEFISIMQEIQCELLEEEKKWIEEYSALSEVNNLEEDEVICPLCKRKPLHQNHSVIFCACGMRIDTQQDGLTLMHLKNSLDVGLQEHETSCSASPNFSLIQLGDSTNLVITCVACKFMYIVI